MGTVLPDNPASQVEFFAQRVSVWAQEPRAIGLSAEECEKLNVAVREAQALRLEADQARGRARAATAEYRRAARRVRELGGLAVAEIKNFARAREVSGEEGSAVYGLARLPIPGRPGPKAVSPENADYAVPRVRDLVAAPDGRGRVILTWRAFAGPYTDRGAGAGMMYQVLRGVNTSGTDPIAPPERLDLIGVVGGPGAGRRTLRFADDTLPAEARGAAYRVVPMRGSASGVPTALVVVRLGGGVGGGRGAVERSMLGAAA